MTISVNQQVDFLWKKLGFGVAKTEVPSIKDATNESIISSPFIPGHKIWAEAQLVPAIMPTLSTPSTHVHTASTAVECTMDITATPNRTWLTGFQDWIPIEFGSTYQIKVFLATAGSSTPTVTGTQLYAGGTNNNDEWYFDYEAGVLHFIGDTLPALTWIGKKIFITGARYVGLKGLSVSAGSTMGNITISGDTISSTNNIVISPATGNVNLSGSTLQNAAYPTLPTDVATYQFVTDTILALHPNTIYQGDSIMRLSDPTGTAGILTLQMDGNLVMTATNTAVTLGQVSISNNTISSLDDLHITTPANKVVLTDSTTAIGMPTGTTAERPVAPAAGYTRYNVTLGTLEWFNGTDWAGPQSQIASQVIIGDGIATYFNLDQSTFANNILVAIQGVTQVPGAPIDGGSYTVAGNVITFTEAPKDEERIEIRFISQSVTPTIPVSQLSASAVLDPAPIVVGTNNVVLDSFPIALYRSAKYLLSIEASDGNAQMTEISLVHNGMSALRSVTSTEMTANGPTTLTYTAQIHLGACELLALSSTSNTRVKIQKTYFTL